MKKVFYLVASLALLFSSCTQEEYCTLESNSSMSVQVVNVEGEQILPIIRYSSGVQDVSSMALQFASENDFYKVLGEIKAMSHEERLSFTERLGFVSLENLYEIADDELDSIADIAISEDDFRLKYTDYKNKYNKVFVFNEAQPSDLSPYIPASDSDDDLAYIVGMNNKFVIGNEVRYVDFENKLRIEDEYIYNKLLDKYSVETRAAGTFSNAFITIVGDRKTIFDSNVQASGSGHIIRYHFGAQKKKWYGWKRDDDRSLIFDDLQMNASAKYKRRHFKDARGNFDFDGGKTTYAHGAFSGTVYIWTDMMVEKDMNGNIIYEDPLVVLNPSVKCDYNKAFVCKISRSF